jgi:hypothetical protein
MKQIFADGISFVILLVVVAWPPFVILDLVIEPPLPIWALLPIGLITLFSFMMLSNQVRHHGLGRSRGGAPMGNVQGIWSGNAEPSSMPVIVIHMIDPIR